jgi:hypothetical protein
VLLDLIERLLRGRGRPSASGPTQDMFPIAEFAARVERRFAERRIAATVATTITGVDGVLTIRPADGRGADVVIEAYEDLPWVTIATGRPPRVHV